MKPEADPPRLLDAPTGTPGELRRALREARAELPSGQQMERLAAKLGPVLGPPPAPPPAASPLAATASSPVLATIVVPALVGGAIVASLLGLHEWTQSAKPREPPAALPSVARAVSPRPTEAAPAASPPSLAALASAAPRPPASTARPGAPTKSEPRGPTEPASDAPEPAAAPESPAAPPTVSPPTPGETAPPSSGASVEGESEMSLIKRAVAALDASPAQTLSLVAEHEKRFPVGALVQEREFVAIQALLRAGRGGEARARAKRFGASYPRSAHLRRIEALLPDKNDP